MQFRDREVTEEERAVIKAITGEYPSASRFLSTALQLINMISDGEAKMKIMLGFEMGVRAATGTDLETLRQVIELIDRGRAKVGNQEAGRITEAMAKIVQIESSHE